MSSTIYFPHCLRLLRRSSILARTLRDLQRRKVFRVAGAYAVTAWLIVEASSVILPRFFEADAVITAIVVVALAGFPAALIFAWMFDLTPEGLVRTEPARRDPDKVHRLSRRGIDFVIIAVLLGIVIYLLYAPDRTDPDISELQSIAVLPFVDLSRDQDQEYFSDGISEQLLNSLVKVDGLRVAARTSSFAFKGKNEDVRKIGEELNVATVLEGSVRKDGDKLRITAQLINVEDGFHLWSHTYDREMDDIFAIQDEISHAIVDALKLTLIGDERSQQIASTPNIEAYELYLLGRHHWHQRTPEALEKALDLFQQAVALDPDYALAYTGIADAHLFLELYGDLPREEALRRAEPAIANALELDDGLAEAYASLGLLRMHTDELTAAELALRKAVELNPNLSMAHMWLGSVYTDTARLGEGYKHYRTAYKLDPLHPVVRLNLAHALSYMGRRDDAAKHLKFWASQHPGEAKGLMMQAYLDLSFGELDEAAEKLNEALALEPDNADAQLMLAKVYLSLGDFQRAEEWMNRSLTTPREKTEYEWIIAGERFYYHMARGELEKLSALADAQLIQLPNWRAQSLTTKQRMALVWPGAAKITVGDTSTGLEILDRVFEEGFAPRGLEPGDLLAVQSLRAHAYKKLGRQAEADALLDESLRYAERARREGWATPGLSAGLAAVYACAGEFDSAIAELRKAVDAGWREYWFAANYPVVQDLEGERSYQQVMAQVKADLDLMLLRVQRAESEQANGTTVSRRHSIESG